MTSDELLLEQLSEAELYQEANKDDLLSILRYVKEEARCSGVRTETLIRIMVNESSGRNLIR
jgi:hypothetical protein